MKRILTMTSYGPPEQKARSALAKAVFDDVHLPDEAADALRRLGRASDVQRYRAGVEDVIGKHAQAFGRDAMTARRERDRLVEMAKAQLARELARTPRVDGLVRGQVIA